MPSSKAEVVISLPCYYTIERKTKKDSTHLVGLNWFRNIHPHLKNKVKQHYSELILNALEGSETKILGKYSTEYRYCYKSKVSDAGNVISMIEKFALDGFKKSGLVVDDSVQFHVQSNGWTVEEDKEQPRVEIIIKEL